MDALQNPEGDLVLAVGVEEDGRLVKLDADGSLQWEHRYELPGWQFGSQLAEINDGGFLLAGLSMSSSPRQVDTWLARCTSSGELEWEKSFGDPAYDGYGTSLIRLKDGTYLIGAIANGILLSRVDKDGSVLWGRFSIGREDNRSKLDAVQAANCVRGQGIARNSVPTAKVGITCTGTSSPCQLLTAIPLSVSMSQTRRNPATRLSYS